MGAQPFTVWQDGLAEASQQTLAAGPVASPMRLGGQPPTTEIQASHLTQVPVSPPDGGDVAMQLAPLVAERRVVPTTPAKAKARILLKRSEPPPDTNSPPGQFPANQEGQIAMLQRQLLDSHGRAGTLSGYVAQAMGMLQEREAW